MTKRTKRAMRGIRRQIAFAGGSAVGITVLGGLKSALPSAVSPVLTTGIEGVALANTVYQGREQLRMATDLFSTRKPRKRKR